MPLLCLLIRGGSRISGKGFTEKSCVFFFFFCFFFLFCFFFGGGGWGGGLGFFADFNSFFLNIP